MWRRFVVIVVLCLVIADRIPAGGTAQGSRAIADSASRPRDPKTQNERRTRFPNIIVARRPTRRQQGARCIRLAECGHDLFWVALVATIALAATLAVHFVVIGVIGVVVSCPRGRALVLSSARPRVTAAVSDHCRRNHAQRALAQLVAANRSFADARGCLVNRLVCSCFVLFRRLGVRCLIGATDDFIVRIGVEDCVTGSRSIADGGSSLLCAVLFLVASPFKR
jgi:hypothetical protein